MSWITRFLFGRSSHVTNDPISHPPRSAITYHFDGDGSYDFDIVGESYHQEALERIVGGKAEEGVEFECVATLVCEDDNPYDSNAVAIYIEGRKVGHLARPVAAGYRDIQRRYGRQGQNATADALIVGGWDRGERGQGSFGVKLDI